MKLILFGNIETWNDAVSFLANHRPDVQIVGLCSLDLGPYADSNATVTLRQALALFKDGLIDGILNSNGENPYYFQLLEELGFHPIYTMPSYLLQQELDGSLLSKEPYIYPYLEVKPELMQLEFHLADHCNLNCKGCTHFSNLVTEPVFADITQFQKDIKRLSELFSHIRHFYLLGGEPFLNPDIHTFIAAVKASFPYTQIIIVTNGLLLLSIQPAVIDMLRKHQAHLSISDYNCLDHDKITRFVREHQLSADLRIEKEEFYKFLNPKGDSDGSAIFEQCSRKNCTFLDKGRIAACCLPFVVKYFNQSIPEMEGIDLYQPDLTGHQIQRQLIRPMELCRYCSTDVPYTWEISKPPFEKEDWCV